MKRKSRIMAMLLTAVLCIVMLPLQAFAVSGSKVAADGVYSSPITAYKYKKGKLDKTYTGTLNVAVIDSEIAGLWITNASDDKMSKLITTEVYYSYVGKEASVAKAGGVDAVSSSTVSTSTSGTSYSTAKKYYTSDLADAVVEALKTAPARTNSSENSAECVQTVTGIASVGDSEGSKLVLSVGLDADGKVVSLAADSASSVGSWDSIVSKNAERYIGKAASDKMDAVSGATMYSAAVHAALTEALANTTSAASAPKITKGDGISWSKGSGNNLPFESDADYDSFAKVTVDGSTVPSNKYTVKRGSTIVTLDSTYLETLGTGSHSIGIVSSTGTASGTFTVLGAADSGSSSGSGSSSDTYTGTIVSSLSDGDYIIVDQYRSYSDYYALGNSTAGNSGSGFAFKGETVTISGNKATVSTPAAVWTWNTSNNTFYNAASGKYLNLPSSSYSADNYFSSSPINLTFYQVNGNEATVYVPSGNGGYYLNATYPSNGKAFSSQNAKYINSSWISSGDGVYFYKIENEQKQKAKITLDKSALTLELGATSSVEATPTGCSNLTATTSNADVATATISGNVISVKGVSAGTAVITVKGTANSGYSAPDSVTFTVTVNPGAGGTGTGSGGTTETTPGNPTYVKSISPENQVAEEYTISLNVTADDLESTTTTPGTQGKGTNLVIVIDVSGSIVGKESALNNAIQSLVKSLPESSQVGVVTFNESASMSKVYSPSSISGLSFSGVENAGTKMATGIAAATSLLNGSGWTNTSNDKAMAIISDFVTDDYNDTINTANKSKNNDITIYTVNIDYSTIATASETSVSQDNKTEKNIASFMRYVSSQYPKASSTNPYFFGNGASITPGAADDSATYVYGAGGGNWSEIFQEIKETQGITEISTVPMKNVVITDTLSSYVELSGAGSNYGVSLETSDDSVSLGTVNISTDAGGNTVVSAALNGELTDGTTYTVKIPVKPTEKAQKEANESPDSTKSFISNVEAKMAYEYDTNNKGEVTYAETPKILVAKQVTLTYDANAGEDKVDNMPNPAKSDATTVATSGAKSGFATFAITSSEPSREGYVFQGWADTADATEATYKNEAGRNSIDIDDDTTLYAVWGAKAVVIKFEPNGGTGTMSDQTGEYGEDIQLKKNEFTREGYNFTGWKVKTVTEPATLLQKIISAKARAKAASGDTYADQDTIVTVTQDIVLEAQWTPIEYTITYELDGGSVSDTNPEKYTIESDTITLNNPTKDGYTFAGWTTGTDLTNASENVTIAKGSTGDRAYTATWTYTPVSHTVTFDSNGGSPVDRQTVTDGNTATEPIAPTRNGYTFKGWTLNSADYDFSTPVTDDITLVAQWEEVATPPAPDKTYTVDTKIANHTYEIYQIFTGDYTAMAEGQETKDILTNIVWGENGTGTTGEKVDDATLQKLYAVVDKPLDDDKLKEIEAIVRLSNPIKTIEVKGSNPASVDLPAGYYLIKDKDDTQTGKEDAYTTYITVVVKDYTVQPKSVLPTVDKKVFDNDASDTTDTTSASNTSNKNPGSGWGETADHAMNESFQFRLIAAIPAPGVNEYNRFDDYETYKLVFHDTMSKGVTFESIDSVSVGDVPIPVKSDTDLNGYEISSITAGEGGAQAWSLTIPNLKNYNDMKSGAEVVVTYNAHLNADAITHDTSADSTDTNKNSVYLEYSNNPNTDHSGDLGKTKEDTVWVFTYKVANTKVDENRNPLQGAGFRLYKGSSEVGLIYDSALSAYRPIASGEAAAEMASAETTGEFNIVGLDAGNYTLKETTTPAGYNTCPDTNITISATHRENDDTNTTGLDLTGSENMNNTIINNSGTVLPSTGGMGTRLFYLFGAILVLGAGVTLISRRRTQA